MDIKDMYNFLEVYKETLFFENEFTADGSREAMEPT